LDRPKKWLLELGFWLWIWGKKERLGIGFKTEEWELSGLWVLNESKESGVGV
jgi:hypothetical protein